MKKIIRILLLLLVIFNLPINHINADVGPKPSVNVEIVNGPDNEYYVTLLSLTDTYGPWHALDETEAESKDEYKAFYDYKDPDGYYLMNYVSKCSKTESFSWSYYPPEQFKIAIYDPATETVKVSDICKREAFDSYFTVDYLDMSVSENIHIEKQLYGFAIRLILTVLVETLLALLFGFKDKLKTVVIVNVVTQVILNLVMAFLSYYTGTLVWIFIYPLLEIIVTAIELIAYLVLLKQYPKWKVILYAILANLITFFIGVYAGILF